MPSLSRALAIALTLVIPEIGYTQSSADSCVLAEAGRQQLLALPLEAFDQDKQNGWRHVATRRCFAAAAALVDQYAHAHRATLSTGQFAMLRWHAGQLYAYAGNTNTARARMLESIDPAEPTPPIFPWNDYVRATVAFLDGDRDLLLQHRQRIAATRSRGNLNVVDQLIERFGQPYLEASPYTP